MLSVEHDAEGNVKVIGEATVHEAEKLRDGLKDARASQADVLRLDLSGLTSLDTCGAQILLSFRKGPRDVRVHSCPSHIRNALERSGLVRHLL